MNYDKEKIEYLILGKIFGNTEAKIVKSEQPDFILKYNSNINAGIEITELYYDGTSARLQNKDGYVEDLINHKKYIHKDDKKKLKVNEITYFSQQIGFDKPVALNALFLPSHKINDYREAVLKTLNDKRAC